MRIFAAWLFVGAVIVFAVPLIGMDDGFMTHRGGEGVVLYGADAYWTIAQGAAIGYLACSAFVVAVIGILTWGKK